MPERILFPEFRDENATSRYPFADTATLTSDDGTQQIELDAFIDASFYPIGCRGRLHLSKVAVTARAVTLSFSDSRAAILCSTTFDPLDPPEVLQVTDLLARPAGVILADTLQLAAFGAWPLGMHTFRLGAAELVASAVVPTPEIGLRGILTEEGELLTGDIWFVGDNGIVVREDAGYIRIDVVGDPLFARKLCFPIDLFVPPLFIQTINGCPPDALGNFNLTAGTHLAEDTVLRISPVPGGLQISAVGQLLRGPD